MSEALNAEMKSLTRTRVVEFWGRKHRITPRLVSEKLGDGKQLIWFEPLATRPNYYLLHVDSKWRLENWEKNPLCDHLEEIYEAIENQYGCEIDTWEHDNGRTYTKHNWFPALHLSCGSTWGAFD